MNNFLSCISAFAVTALSIYLLRPLATRLRLLDIPFGRKQHQGNVPLVGGVAMFLGFVIGLLTIPDLFDSYRRFLGIAALLVIIGVLDDFFRLSAKTKFIAQILAAILMATWCDANLLELGNLLFFANFILGKWSILFTCIAVVGAINAVNMSDGVDGLCGGLTLVSLALFAYVAADASQLATLQALFILMAALLAFLCFNFRFRAQKPATVFMGDAGSMLLGLALVWFGIQLSQGPAKATNPVTILYILAVPVFDMLSVMLHRLQSRKSLVAPDREHIHHLLKDMGYNASQITLLLSGIAAVIGAVGIAGHHAGLADGVLFLGFIGLLVLYLVAVTRIRHSLRSGRSYA